MTEGEEHTYPVPCYHPKLAGAMTDRFFLIPFDPRKVTVQPVVPRAGKGRRNVPMYVAYAHYHHTVDGDPEEWYPLKVRPA